MDKFIYGMIEKIAGKPHQSIVPTVIRVPDPQNPRGNGKGKGKGGAPQYLNRNGVVQLTDSEIAGGAPQFRLKDVNTLPSYHGMRMPTAEERAALLGAGVPEEYMNRFFAKGPPAYATVRGYGSDRYPRYEDPGQQLAGMIASEANTNDVDDSQWILEHPEWVKANYAWIKEHPEWVKKHAGRIDFEAKGASNKYIG